MGWALIQFFGRQGITAIVYVILTYFLTPRDFGLITLVTLVVNFLGIFNDLGFGAALVQRKEVDDCYWSTVFFLNVATGTVLALGMALGARPIASLLEHSELTPIVACLAVSLLTNALTITQVSYRVRNLDFRYLAYRDITASTCGGVLAIVVAAAGGGVWSVVANTLTTSMLSLCFLWKAAGYRPHWRLFSWPCVRDLWQFSSRMWLFAVIKYLVQNLDKYLVNGLFGAHGLGLYSVALRIIVMPLAGVVGAAGNYVFPHFSRHQDDNEALRRDYRVLLKTTVGIGIPAALFIIFTCPQLIVAFFNPAWSEAIPLTRIAVLGAIGQIVISPVGQLMKAMGRPGWLINWTLLLMVATCCALLAGARWGLEGAVAGWAAAQVLGACASLRILSVLLVTSIGWLLRSMFAPLAVGGAGLALYLVVAKAGLFEINLPVTLAASVLLSVGLLLPLWQDDSIRSRMIGLMHRAMG